MGFTLIFCVATGTYGAFMAKQVVFYTFFWLGKYTKKSLRSHVLLFSDSLNMKRMPSSSSQLVKRTWEAVVFKPFSNRLKMKRSSDPCRFRFVNGHEVTWFWSLFYFFRSESLLWKVLLDRNGRAVLSSMVLYFFGLERHNFTKKDTPGVSFSLSFQTL